MNCFVIKVAELNVLINTRFDRLLAICKDYVVDTDDYDISVSVSDADIMRERDISEGEFSDAYLESVCMYRNLCLQLPKYGAFLLHASCIEVDGVAYAFSAPSGTGKSTHTGINWAIELCEPKKVSDYLILGTDKLPQIEKAMKKRGITKEQYAVAPVDIFESDYLEDVK